MELWQMDIVGGFALAGGTSAKALTGIDDHSEDVARERTRAVGDGLRAALTGLGVLADIVRPLTAAVRDLDGAASCWSSMGPLLITAFPGSTPPSYTEVFFIQKRYPRLSGAFAVMSLTTV
jgi:hypothetical protein